MKSVLILSLLLAQAALAEAVFTDVWFNRGSQVNNPASLGPTGVASMHYGISQSPPVIGNVVGQVNWFSSSNTTLTALKGDMWIVTGGTSIRPFQQSTGAPLDPIFMGRLSTGFTDTWTLVTDPPVVRGVIRMSFDITGATTLIGGGGSTYGNAALRATAGTLDTVSTGINGAGVYTLDMPILVGSPQAVSVFLELRASVLGPSKTVSLDYSHTAVLTQLSFIPEGSSTSRPFTLSSAAAFSPLVENFAVPEPMELATPVFSLATLLFFWKPRRKQDQN